MNKAIKVGILLVLAAIAFFFFCLGSVTLRFSTIPDNVNATLTRTQTELTLMGKATNDLRLTLDNVNKGAIDERLYFEQTLPDVTKKSQEILADADRLLVSARSTSDDARDTIAASTKTITDLDTRVTDPAIQQSLTNIEETTAHSAVVADNVAATTGDIRDKVHSYTNPPPKKWYQKIWNPIKFTGELTFDFIR